MKARLSECKTADEMRFKENLSQAVLFGIGVGTSAQMIG
jgi:hypothetical protein